jgi:hypothetical protein
MRNSLVLSKNALFFISVGSVRYDFQELLTKFDPKLHLIRLIKPIKNATV